MGRSGTLKRLHDLLREAWNSDDSSCHKKRNLSPTPCVTQKHEKKCAPLHVPPRLQLFTFFFFVPQRRAARKQKKSCQIVFDSCRRHPPSSLPPPFCATVQIPPCLKPFSRARSKSRLMKSLLMLCDTSARNPTHHGIWTSCTRARTHTHASPLTFYPHNHGTKSIFSLRPLWWFVGGGVAIFFATWPRTQQINFPLQSGPFSPAPSSLSLCNHGNTVLYVSFSNEPVLSDCPGLSHSFSAIGRRGRATLFLIATSKAIH